MQRITITLDDDLVQEIDALGYGNRSEALRDLARAGLREAARNKPAGGSAAGVLAYVYDHARRDLPNRLTDTFHDHHELSVATLHVHLDHHSCLELAVLKGDGEKIQRFADAVVAERGVRHGGLLLVLPAEEAKHHVHHHGESQD